MSLLDAKQRSTVPWLGWQLGLLFLMHMAGDFYAAFYGPLVPFLEEKLDLTLIATGVIGAVYATTAHFTQLLFGFVSERMGRRNLVAGGVLLAAAGMGALGFAWNLASVYGALVLAGIGVGMFHPCGAAIAGSFGARRRSMAVGIYMTGGNLGISLAPLVVPVVAMAGMVNLGWLALPGIAFVVLLWLTLHDEVQSPEHRNRPRVDMRKMFRQLWGIHLHVILRFIPLTAYFLWLTLFCVKRGMTKVEAGRVLAVFVLAGAAGSLAGGWLAERVARKPLAVLTELGAGLLLLCAPRLEGAAFYAALTGGSVLFYVAMPLQIVMAQERAPRNQGAASGIVMGFAYGIAGLTLIPLGWLGDHFTDVTGSEVESLARMLQISTVSLFAAAVVALFLRSRETGDRQPVTGDLIEKHNDE